MLLPDRPAHRGFDVCHLDGGSQCGHGHRVGGQRRAGGFDWLPPDFCGGRRVKYFCLTNDPWDFSKTGSDRCDPIDREISSTFAA